MIVHHRPFPFAAERPDRTSTIFMPPSENSTIKERA
jgi:hypothetical protein